LWAGYAATFWLDLKVNPTQNDFNLLPGSPLMLFFAVNYVVVRVWWKIDPLGLEACERGIILYGFYFRPWDEISRYTWSGIPRRRLSLF
jgi:hypothetical protein